MTFQELNKTEKILLRTMKFQELSETEKIHFRTMKKVQRDRMEHQNAVCFSEGKKQEDHQRKKAVCLNKESVLEAVLDEAGLLESYKKWSGLYN